MFIFYSIHYPYPDKESLLAESMHEFGELMRTQPGLVFGAPYPFKNPENGTLMGVTVWVSQAAFEAAMAALADKRTRPPAEWEMRPTEVYRLNAVG